MFLKTSNLLISLTLLFSSHSYAAKISQVKNNKALIDLEDEYASINQEFTILNSKKKKIGTGKFLQIKNGKAVGLITSGTPAGSEKIKIVFKSSDEDDEDSEVSQSVTRKDPVLFRANNKRFSGSITTLNNTMITKQSDGTLPAANVEDVSMSGSAIGFTGVIDWPMNRLMTFRGSVGYEPFKATGTAVNLVCSSLTTRECNAEINYLSTGAYARFEILKANGLLWAAIGGTFKFPMTKNSTALKESDIKLTTTYGFAIGYDLFIDTKHFIPISYEQQSFLKSDTVSASITMLRAGFGVNY